MNDDDKIIKIIDEAMMFYEKGKSRREIFDLFPERQTELQKMFQIIENLRDEGKKIEAPKELLIKILAGLPEIENVTDFQFNRSLNKEEEEKSKRKGRSSTNYIIQIYDLMTTKWKIWAPLGIVSVAILIVLGYYQFSYKIPEYAGEETQSIAVTAKEALPIVSLAPATGNVDDAINALLGELSDDELVFAAEQEDKTFLTLDSQEVSDFGQIYNENEF